MAQIVAVSNLKGGVAKTVTTVNLAVGLGMKGKRVLVVDVDAQCNATEYLSLAESDGPSIADVLIGRDGRYAAISEAIVQTPYQNVDLAPCSFSFIGANEAIVQDLNQSREYRLKRALREVEDQYDYILIDCPPSLGIVTVNAMLASRQIIIPFKIDRFAFDAIKRVYGTVQALTEGYDAEYAHVTILFTIDERTRANRSIKKMIVAESPMGASFETSIRKCASVVESTFELKPVLVTAPRCTASKDYLELTKEVIELYGEV